MDNIENNKLMAEFMDKEKTYDIIDANDNVTLRRNLSKKQAELLALTFKGYKDENKNSIIPKVVLWNSLKYHESWNWLMPVVEKINNTGRFEVNIGYGRCYISDGEDKLTLSLQGKTTFHAIHKAIVEFINFYNENLKK